MKCLTRLIFVLVFAGALAGCSHEKRLSSSSPEALRAYREGVVHWERFYYAEAKDSFERALAYDSAFAMARCRLAMIDAATGNLSAAQDAMARALRLSGTVTQREQLFISMWHHHLDFDNAKAAEAADSLLKLYPDEKEAYLFRGSLYEQMDKNLDAAIGYYQKAVDSDSNYAQAVMSLGYAYSSLGDQQKGVEQMQRYIRLAPDAADPRASYADLLVRAGRYDEALEQYQKSLDLKPDYWYAIREIGNLYALLGRLSEAEQQIHKSLRLLPPGPSIDAQHLIVDGALNMRRRKYDEAAEQFRSAVRIDSLNFSASEGLAYALGKLKKFPEAGDVLLQISEQLKMRHLLNSVAMVPYHLARAALLTDEGRWSGALASCDSAMEYATPLARAEIARQKAETHFAEGALEEAIDDCDQALEVNPNRPIVLLTLAKVYHRKGDIRMTVEIGSKLLALWAGADRDFEDRNDLLRLLGKPPLM